VEDANNDDGSHMGPRHQTVRRHCLVVLHDPCDNVGDGMVDAKIFDARMKRQTKRNHCGGVVVVVDYDIVDDSPMKKRRFDRFYL
jgi:hypothetical protein